MPTTLNSVKAKFKAIRRSVEPPARRISGFTTGSASKGDQPVNTSSEAVQLIESITDSADLLETRGKDARQAGTLEGHHEPLAAVTEPFEEERCARTMDPDQADDGEDVYEVIGTILAGKIRRPSVSTAGPLAEDAEGRLAYRSSTFGSVHLGETSSDEPQGTLASDETKAHLSTETTTCDEQHTRPEKIAKVAGVPSASDENPVATAASEGLHRSREAARPSGTKLVERVSDYPAVRTASFSWPLRVLAVVLAIGVMLLWACLTHKTDVSSSLSLAGGADQTPGVSFGARVASAIVLCCLVYCHRRWKVRSSLSPPARHVEVQEAATPTPNQQGDQAVEAKGHKPDPILPPAPEDALDIPLSSTAQFRPLPLSSEDKETLQAAQGHKQASIFRQIFAMHRLHPFRMHQDDACPAVDSDMRTMGLEMVRLGQESFFRDLCAGLSGAYIGGQTCRCRYDVMSRSLEVEVYAWQDEVDSGESEMANPERWAGTMDEIRALLKHLKRIDGKHSKAVDIKLSFRPISEWSMPVFRRLMALPEKDPVRNRLKQAIDIANEMEVSLSTAHQQNASENHSQQLREILFLCKPACIAISCLPHLGWQREAAGLPPAIVPGPRRYPSPFGAIGYAIRAHYVERTLPVLQLRDALPVVAGTDGWIAFAFADCNMKQLEIRLLCSDSRHPDCHRDLVTALLDEQAGMLKLLGVAAAGRSLAVRSQDDRDLACFKAAFDSGLDSVDQAQRSEAETIRDGCVNIVDGSTDDPQPVWTSARDLNS